MTTALTILSAMSRAFFASAYADQAEEAGQPLSGEIMDQLPTYTDRAARQAAKTLAMQMAINRYVGLPISQAIEALYRRALEIHDGTGDRELSPENFGHYCAMQAMGTGVGLRDAFGEAVENEIGPLIGYVEFGSHSLEKDYF